VRTNESTDQRPRRTSERGFTTGDRAVKGVVLGTVLGAAYFGFTNTAGIAFDVTNGALNSVITGSQSTLKAVFPPVAIAGAIPGVFIGEIAALNHLRSVSPSFVKLTATAGAGLLLGGATSAWLSYAAAMLGQFTFPKHLANAIASTIVRNGKVESAATFNCAVARLGVVGGAEIGFAAGLTYAVAPAVTSLVAQIRENRRPQQTSVV
jgi:hypothetical protein